MGKTKKTNVLPTTMSILKEMGNNIRLARLRRDLSVNLICERAAISRATLWKIENGDPSVSFGAYAVVLHALNGMDKDLLLVCKDDRLGRTLVDLKIDVRKRATKNDKHD